MSGQAPKRARHANDTLKTIYEMTTAERKALAHPGHRILTILVPHPTEANTWIVAGPKDLPRPVATSLSRLARSVPADKDQWKIPGIQGYIVYNLMDWAKRGCKGDIMKAFDFTGLNTQNIIDHVDAAWELGMDASLLQFSDAYFALPITDMFALWSEAKNQGLDYITDKMSSRFSSYLAQMNSLAEVMEVWDAAGDQPQTFAALDKAIWYRVNKTELSVADVIAVHACAPHELYAKKAIHKVIETSYKQDKSTIPAGLPADLAVIFQKQFDFLNGVNQPVPFASAVARAAAAQQDRAWAKGAKKH